MLYKKLYKYCLYDYMHRLNVYMQCFDIILRMPFYKEFKTNSWEVRYINPKSNLCKDHSNFMVHDFWKKAGWFFFVFVLSRS